MTRKRTKPGERKTKNLKVKKETLKDLDGKGAKRIKGGAIGTDGCASAICAGGPTNVATCLCAVRR